MEEKKFYRIKDISEFVDEAPSTLRYWESEFKELKPRRGEKGRRLYTTTDLDTIRKIKFLLRTKGMHISAAKEQLHKNHKNISTKSAVITDLEEVKKELTELLKSLNKTRT